jgi:hypothetical protein
VAAPTRAVVRIGQRAKLRAAPFARPARAKRARRKQQAGEDPPVSPFRTVMRGGFTPVVPLTRPRPDDVGPEEFAIDTALTLSSCPPTDQRGLPRPVAAPETCDPGAMELQPGEM